LRPSNQTPIEKKHPAEGVLPEKKEDPLPKTGLRGKMDPSMKRASQPKGKKSRAAFEPNKKGACCAILTETSSERLKKEKGKKHDLKPKKEILSPLKEKGSVETTSRERGGDERDKPRLVVQKERGPSWVVQLRGNKT